MRFLGDHIESYLKLKSLSEVHRLPPFYMLPTPVANFFEPEGGEESMYEVCHSKASSAP